MTISTKDKKALTSADRDAVEHLIKHSKTLSQKTYVEYIARRLAAANRFRSHIEEANEYLCDGNAGRAGVLIGQALDAETC